SKWRRVMFMTVSSRGGSGSQPAHGRVRVPILQVLRSRLVQPQYDVKELFRRRREPVDAGLRAGCLHPVDEAPVRLVLQAGRAVAARIAIVGIGYEQAIAAAVERLRPEGVHLRTGSRREAQLVGV